jgi:hypothetical protein
MKCKQTIFSGHSIRRIFERGIKKEEILEVITNGEKVADYPDDRPFPSSLFLGFVRQKPLHVVVAFDAASETCYVITAYEPDLLIWNDDFKTRRLP